MMNGNSKTTAETQMQVAIGLLLDTIGDQNPVVTKSAGCTLRKIAKYHPNEILKACCNYCERSTKGDQGQLQAVMLIINDVCSAYIIQVDGDTVLALIYLCMDLMTRNSNEMNEVALGASKILVALGKEHSIQIMDALMRKFQPGVIPHPAIPHTMASLAATNAFGVVPHLKNILDIMLPLLSNTKTDTMRQTFCLALHCFCDSIMEYTSNLTQAPDPTLGVADFQTEMSVAYDILFSNWLTTRQPHILSAVLKALSSMFGILSTERIRQNSVKTTQMLLVLFKRHKEALPVVKYLGTVISVSGKCDVTLLEPLLGPILHALSELVHVIPNCDNADALRTQAEVLRCFEYLAWHYSNYVIDYVINLLRNNNEKERVRGLSVLAHLINAVDVVVKSRLKDVNHVLNDMLPENPDLIGMGLMNVIVAFAYKGFLNSGDETTQKYVLFIIKLCGRLIFLKDGKIKYSSDLEVTADNALYMLTTSVDELAPTLWDTLLKCFLMPEYSLASVSILRCLTNLARRSERVGVYESAFVRCLALLAQPLSDFRGTFALKFLQTIRLFEDDATQSVWDAEIPLLLRYLEENYATFNKKEWEDLLFDFLSLLAAAVKDEKFKEGLIMNIKEQLAMYSNKDLDKHYTSQDKPIEKRFLLKSIAVISCYISNAEMVQQVVNIILENIKPQLYHELQACSEAIGICSRSNLKIVLATLRQIRTDMLLKRPHKVFHFGFMKDSKIELGINRVRYAVLTSYAEVCKEAPPEVLLQTVESEILKFVLDELASTKDPVIRKTCLETVGAVAQAMHPDNNKLHIYMQERDGVLKTVCSLMQLHNGPEYIELFPIILPILTSLVRLPHVLESEQRLELLKLCFDNVFNASAIYCKLEADKYAHLNMAPTVYSSLPKLNALVEELLLQCLTPATLDEIVTLLEPWLSRKKAEQRLPALEALRTALQTYLDNVKFGYEGPSTFGQTGVILAKIIPRCADPNKAIRKVAAQCAHLVLCIAGRYEGHMRDHDRLLTESLRHINEQIDTDDPRLLFNLTTDLANSVASNVPKYQLNHFVDHLMDGCLDIETSAAQGASIVLCTVVKLKASELQPHVAELTEKFLSILSKTNCTTVRSNLLGGLKAFAMHHLKVVVHVLLQQPLPYEPSVCAVWAALGTDSAMLVEIFDQLKKLLKNTPLYEDTKGIEPLRLTTLTTLQSICAFFELLKSNQSHALCKQDFPELFTLFYIYLASCIGTAAPVHTASDKKTGFVPNRDAYRLNPFKLVLDTFKSFLQNAGNSQAALNLSTCTEGVSSFLETVPNVTEKVCAENSESLAWLTGSLGPYIRSEVELQRIAVAAFFASLLQNKISDHNAMLSENIVETLLATQNDKSATVRRLCMQGLGNGCEYLNAEIVQRHCSELLDAFVQALDYSSAGESEVVYEAMLSFSKLLHAVKEKHLNHCQVTVAIRIKPLLQQENSLLRLASFRLLGDLGNSVGSDDAFQEQVNGNLITLLLHLSDDDPDVIKACKYCMRKIGRFLDCPAANAMIQEHLIEDGELIFAQFTTDFIKFMREKKQDLYPHLIAACLSYYKSPWTQIRANAALLTGVLYSQLTEELKEQIPFDTVTYRLLQILKDEQPEVRARAAEAIAYLFVA